MEVSRHQQQECGEPTPQHYKPKPAVSRGMIGGNSLAILQNWIVAKGVVGQVPAKERFGKEQDVGHFFCHDPQ